MNVNYFFHNATRSQANTSSIPGTEDFKFISRLHRCKDTEIIKYFESVMKINNWGSSDKILSYPDDTRYEVYVYENSKLISRNNYLAGDL